VFRVGVILAGLVTLSLSVGADDLNIDDFIYASDAEAQAAWSPSSTSPVVTMAGGAPWGERVMLMPCPFTEDVSRAYWDRDVALDLSGYQAISLEVHVPDPGAVSAFTLYFRVPGGWHTNTFALPSRGGTRFAWTAAASRPAARRGRGIRSRHPPVAVEGGQPRHGPGHP